MINKQLLGLFGAILLLCIAVYFAAYASGKRDGKAESKTKRELLIDSLTNIIATKEAYYLTIKDSLDHIKSENNKENELIQIVKNTIKNEIKKNTKTVYLVPDSIYQSYIDSLRTATGFRPIRY